jgi:hypothetical protein
MVFVGLAQPDARALPAATTDRDPFPLRSYRESLICDEPHLSTRTYRPVGAPGKQPPWATQPGYGHRLPADYPRVVGRRGAVIERVADDGAVAGVVVNVGPGRIWVRLARTIGRGRTTCVAPGSVFVCWWMWRVRTIVPTVTRSSRCGVWGHVVSWHVAMWPRSVRGKSSGLNGMKIRRKSCPISSLRGISMPRTSRRPSESIVPAAEFRSGCPRTGDRSTRIVPERNR